MSSAPAASETARDPRPFTDGSWSFQRRWLLIVIVFIVQIGLIFVFGERQAAASRPAAPSFVVNLITDPVTLADFDDPTLFALPHPRGFAGEIWSKTPPSRAQPFRWNEPPRLLALAPDDLATSFTPLREKSVFASFELDARPPAVVPLPLVPEIKIPMRTQSSLRVTGNLAARTLLNPPALTPRYAAELQTNTVLRVYVGADGNVRSVIQLLLPPGGGPEKMDHDAISAAWASRFAPLPLGAPEPTEGLLIFEWLTLPLAETNPPSTKP